MTELTEKFRDDDLKKWVSEKDAVEARSVSLNPQFIGKLVLSNCTLLEGKYKTCKTGEYISLNIFQGSRLGF